jgi:hypothetical protein
MADSPTIAIGPDTHRFKVTGDVHLLLLDGDKILFGRRQNTGFEDDSYHVPSGHLEAGESMISALICEAKRRLVSRSPRKRSNSLTSCTTHPVVAALHSSSPCASGKEHRKPRTEQVW